MNQNRARKYWLGPKIGCLIGVASLLLPALSRAQAPLSYTITTAAGNGAMGFSGDGGAATNAQINLPMHVAVDKSGNLYIADQFNHNVRKVATDGTITTVAGKNSSGYAGDGAAATGAQLSYPCGVAVDAAGNLFIADSGNHRVRKVSTGGTITTVAGNGVAAYTGDGGLGTDGSLSGPMGLAVDAGGNLYIADVVNNVVRRLGTDGKIFTVAGTGAIGEDGDGATATNSRLNRPEGVAVDSAGNIYIADTSNHRIRKVLPDGTMIIVAGKGISAGFAGDEGPAIGASLSYPDSIAVDSGGTLYLLDSGNLRVRAVLANGLITTVAGSGRLGDGGDGGPAKRAAFRFPNGLALDAGGNLYISDTENGRIRLLTLVPPIANPDVQ